MKNFKLGMYCLGNGTTLVDESFEVEHDYPKIGHISEHGVIELYVSKSEIPEKDMETIKKCAARSKDRFMEMWNGMDIYQKYDYMFDIPTVGCGVSPMQKIALDNLGKPLKETVNKMEKAFFETSM